MDADPDRGDGPTRIEELAALCIAGIPEAGIDLVRRLWAHGVEPTIGHLVAIAAPAGRIPAVAFDALADALADAIADRDTRP